MLKQLRLFKQSPKTFQGGSNFVDVIGLGFFLEDAAVIDLVDHLIPVIQVRIQERIERLRKLGIDA